MVFGDSPDTGDNFVDKDYPSFYNIYNFANDSFSEL